MEFITGTNEIRYAVRMATLTQSGFFGYTNSMGRISSKTELIERVTNNSLILDVETKGALRGINVDALSLEELKLLVRSYLEKKTGVVTEPFTVDKDRLREYPMEAGQYIIFDERTMHGSRPAGANAKLRMAINARYALGTTVVYPQRFMNDPIDGQNLDISAHRCIRVHGTEFHPRNVYLT
jgi:hypothetical protein